MSFKPIYPKSVPQDALTPFDRPDAATPPHPADEFSGDRHTLKSVPFLGLRSPDAKSREANNLLGNGFLRREQTGLISGPTGIGKSVFLSQAAVCWAVGRPYFGIRPQNALRILIVQSENDDEDMAEMRDGILVGLNLTPVELQLASSNIHLMRCFSAGAAFLRDATGGRTPSTARRPAHRRDPGRLARGRRRPRRETARGRGDSVKRAWTLPSRRICMRWGPWRRCIKW